MKSIYDMFRHQAGQVADLDQAFKNLGMDFPVGMRKKYFKLKDGSEREITHSMVIVREDSEIDLGEASEIYGLVSYPLSFAFIKPMLKDNNIELMGGHVTGNGERAYIALKSPDDTIVLSDDPTDKVENYFLLRSSHDGTGSIEARIFPYRALNGTAFVPSENAAISFRHSRKVDDRLAQAEHTVSSIRNEWLQFSEDAKMMSSIEMPADKLEKYFLTVIGTKTPDSPRAKNILEELIETYNNGVGAKLGSTKGTIFGALQAVNEWVDFKRTVRKSKFYDEISARVETLVSGSGARQKAKAYAVALGLMQKMKGF